MAGEKDIATRIRRNRETGSLGSAMNFNQQLAAMEVVRVARALSQEPGLRTLANGPALMMALDCFDAGREPPTRDASPPPAPDSAPGPGQGGLF